MLNRSIPEGYGLLTELEVAVTGLVTHFSTGTTTTALHRTGSIRAHTRMRWCMTLQFHETGNMYPTDHSAR